MKAKAKVGAIALIATALAVLCVPAGAHDGGATKRSCDISTLRGLYLLKGSGFAVINAATVPKAILGSVRFNGDGTLVVEALTLTVLNLPPVEQSDRAGSYTLESNCTGTLSIPNGPTWNLFVSSPGSAYQIQTGGPDHGIILADLRLISR